MSSLFLLIRLCMWQCRTYNSKIIPFPVSLSHVYFRFLVILIVTIEVSSLGYIFIFWVCLQYLLEGWQWRVWPSSLWLCLVVLMALEMISICPYVFVIGILALSCQLCQALVLSGNKFNEHYSFNNLFILYSTDFHWSSNFFLTHLGKG